MNPVISFEKDFENKKIVVTSKFKASLVTIWDAFTNPAVTDKWWAPKPYKAVTKEISFKEGGRWLYYMLSPEGDKHWCIADFSNIQLLKSYDVSDAFCDENGVINTNHPRMTWNNVFVEEDGKTTVINTVSAEPEDLKKILEMGFEEGYKMGLNQLSELLQSRIK